MWGLCPPLREQVLFQIPPTVFYPQPSVTSALISLDFTGEDIEIDCVAGLTGKISSISSLMFYCVTSVVYIHIDNSVVSEGLLSWTPSPSPSPPVTAPG